MSSPRIVATDLDGTLLTSGRTVSPRTRDALRLAGAAGAVIVFVTARPPRGVREIAEQAGVTGTAICSNGAIVYDLDADEITESLPLDPGAARRAALALAEALPGVTKAAALDRVCRAHGVPASEVVAFGDMPNDLAVLTYAGLGYAMANAHASVPRRTLSNDEHGVAAVLERLYG
ncbi:HAD hydrolase family protein [Nonomuraea wenchangensis]